MYFKSRKTKAIKSFLRLPGKGCSGNDWHYPAEKTSVWHDATVSEIKQSLKIEYGQQWDFKRDLGKSKELFIQQFQIVDWSKLLTVPKCQFHIITHLQKTVNFGARGKTQSSIISIMLKCHPLHCSTAFKNSHISL